MTLEQEKAPRFVTLRRALGTASGKAGLGIFVFFLLLAIYGATLDPYGPRAMPCYATCAGLPPFASLAHPLGTFPTGADVFSEIAHGTPLDLGVSLGATAIATLVGVVVGVAAGYFRKLVNDVLLSFTQVVLLLPSFLIVVFYFTVNGDTNLFVSPLAVGYFALLLGLFSWPPIALVVRNAVMSIREEEFVQSARALGAGRRHMIRRHILPNVVAPIASVAGIVFAVNILAESLLVFLGLVPALEYQRLVTTWGLLLSEGIDYIFGYWWISFFAGFMIALAVLGFAFLGDAVAEALNPKARTGKRSATPRARKAQREPERTGRMRGRALLAVAVIVVVGLAVVSGAYLIGVFPMRGSKRSTGIAVVTATSAACSISGNDCIILLTNSGDANASLGYDGGDGLSYFQGVLELSCPTPAVIGAGSTKAIACSSPGWFGSPTPGTPFTGELTLADNSTIPFSGQFTS